MSWKGPKAIEKYGDKGKNGVVEAKSEGSSKVVIGRFRSDDLEGTAYEYYQQTISKDIPHSPAANKALILIDGKPSNKKDLDALAINQVKTFNIKPAGDDETIAKYGNKAKNGLIEFVTKK